jgi:hypothetical protein
MSVLCCPVQTGSDKVVIGVPLPDDAFADRTTRGGLLMLVPRHRRPWDPDGHVKMLSLVAAQVGRGLNRPQNRTIQV